MMVFLSIIVKVYSATYSRANSAVNAAPSLALVVLGPDINEPTIPTEIFSTNDNLNWPKDLYKKVQNAFGTTNNMVDILGEAKKKAINTANLNPEEITQTNPSSTVTAQDSDESTEDASDPNMFLGLHIKKMYESEISSDRHFNNLLEIYTSDGLLEEYREHYAKLNKPLVHERKCNTHMKVVKVGPTDIDQDSMLIMIEQIYDFDLFADQCGMTFFYDKELVASAKKSSQATYDNNVARQTVLCCAEFANYYQYFRNVYCLAWKCLKQVPHDTFPFTQDVRNDVFSIKEALRTALYESKDKQISLYRQFLEKLGGIGVKTYDLINDGDKEAARITIAINERPDSDTILIPVGFAYSNESDSKELFMWLYKKSGVILGYVSYNGRINNMEGPAFS